MSCSIITLIAPNEYISLCGEIVNIHEIETIKLNQNGNIIYFTKRNIVPLTEDSGLFHLDEEDKKLEQENKD